MKEKRLGRGLDALLGGAQTVHVTEPAPAPPAAVTPSSNEQAARDGAQASAAGSAASVRNESAAGFREISVSDIRPNPNQPRKQFEQDALDSLAKSIRSEGVVQPVIVRNVGNGYELVSGERRWRAAQRAALAVLPAIVVDADDKRSLEIALVENLQREDLNAMEKAAAFSEIIRKFDYTQDVLADRLGMDRSSLANYVRLLDLQDEVKTYVSRGTISMGHARALLGVENSKEQLYLAKRVISEALSVRKLENIIRIGGGRLKKRSSAQRDPLTGEIEDKLRTFFGTKVTLEMNGKRGRILIDFYDDKQLTDILDKIGVSL